MAGRSGRYVADHHADTWLYCAADHAPWPCSSWTLARQAADAAGQRHQTVINVSDWMRRRLGRGPEREPNGGPR